MPPVFGILETSLDVSNPHQAAEFYRKLFDFETLLESDRLVALNVADRNVLLLFQQGHTSEPVVTEGGIIPGHTGSGPNHLAFSIAHHDLAPWQQRLASLGIAVESIVNWPTGGISVYFRDPDNHLVELVTSGLWSIY
ncbi:MAG: VOC family protein [Planctomycetes bacterium]|nr:VOC family protein [Planctomycetota bacterium]